MPGHRSGYSQPPVDSLDAAVIAIGLLYEAELPEEELTLPTFIPDFVRSYRSALAPTEMQSAPPILNRAGR